MTETTNFNRIDAARRTLAALLHAANGGTAPSRIRLRVSAPGEAADTAFGEDDLRDRLTVTVDDDGRMTAAIGIATHWTMLWHHDLRFARSAGQQLFLLGTAADKPIHAWIEDDRFYLDRGLPFLSVHAEREAMASFDAEFATRVGGGTLMAKTRSRLATGTAIVVANAAPKAVVINADKDPNPKDPHSWLPLIGEPAGAQGIRIMQGTLRLEYRNGWRNSAEAMVKAKLVPVPSSDPLGITAIRHDVLVPDGVDDIYADPWLLPRLIDHGLAREVEGKTPIWCYVTVTNPAARHLHESWKVGRRAAERICDRYAVPVMLVQHAPHHASNAAAPHLHFLIGVRRLDARGFSTAVAALTNDKTRDLFAAIWAEVASDG